MTAPTYCWRSVQSWPHNKHNTWVCAVDLNQLIPFWCVHDPKGAKILNYAKWKRSADAMFVVFTLIFALTRMVILPFWWVWWLLSFSSRQSSLICACFFRADLEMILNYQSSTGKNKYVLKQIIQVVHFLRLNVTSCFQCTLGLVSHSMIDVYVKPINASSCPPGSYTVRGCIRWSASSLSLATTSSTPCWWCCRFSTSTGGCSYPRCSTNVSSARWSAVVQSICVVCVWTTSGKSLRGWHRVLHFVHILSSNVWIMYSMRVLRIYLVVFD